MAKPALISDIHLKITMADDPVRKLDESVLVKYLTSAPGSVLEVLTSLSLSHYNLQRLSSLFLSKNLVSSLRVSVHLALCHLMAGNLEAAISQAGRASEHFGATTEVTAMTSLTWEIIANHEDAQTKEILSSAFQWLPLSQIQKNSSQLKSLWPNVVTFQTKIYRFSGVG